MRRFRFVGRQNEWPMIKSDFDYNSDFIPPSYGTSTIFDLASRYPEDWQEVFEEPQVFNRVHFNENPPLHKDTDLGYYAGLAMAELCKVWGTGHEIRCCKDSIAFAKELIKQLDQESGNNPAPH